MLIGSFDKAYDIFKRAREKSEPVIFPTDTIYGIGAQVDDIAANRKIYDIKGREKNKPFPVLVGSYGQAAELAEITDSGRRIIEKLWPGPFTFIMKARENVDSLFTLNGNIALRMPSTDKLASLLKKTGAISATSANLSGVAYAPGTDGLINIFKPLVNFFVIADNGSSVSSTIIDITGSEPKLIRGEINLHEIIDNTTK